MNKVFVLGSINIDYVMTACRMPEKGETMHGDNFIINEGGKGANQAVAVAKYGVPVYMIGCIGNDPLSQSMLRSLQEYGVITKLIKTDTTKSTGAAFITVAGGDNRIILAEGANESVDRKDVDTALEMAEKGDVFIAQNEIRKEITAYGLEKAYEKGLITIFNPAPAASDFQEVIAKFVRILVVNEVEAVQITSKNNFTAAIEQLQKYPCDKIIITLGDKGCLTLSEGKLHYTPAMKVQVTDTTAAGDTFIGYMAGAIASKESMKNAVLYAVAASALTVTESGAQCSIPAKIEVENMLSHLQLPDIMQTIDVQKLKMLL